MLASLTCIFILFTAANCLLCCSKAHSPSSSMLFSTLSPAYSYSALENVTQNPLCLFTNIFTIENNTVKIINSTNNKNCKEIYDSRLNKSGVFESNQLFSTNVRLANVNNLVPVQNTGRVVCIYEFFASGDERVQIKFLDFNIPTEHKNSSECNPNDSLQLLTQVKGKYEVLDFYCGAFLPKPIMSKGPKLILQFIGKYPSNQQKIGYYGFKAEYKFLTNDAILTQSSHAIVQFKQKLLRTNFKRYLQEFFIFFFLNHHVLKDYGITTGHQLGNNCSFVYNSTIRKMGFFTSPNFPGLYPQNIACHYFFYGELEEKVEINFSFFDVEGIDSCGYMTASDYVEFSNFISTDRKFRKYCGKRNKFEIHSDDRFFRVSFYSNDRFDRNGFRAYYEFKGTSTPFENTSVQSYTSGFSTAPYIVISKNLVIIGVLFYYFCANL